MLRIRTFSAWVCGFEKMAKLFDGEEVNTELSKAGFSWSHLPGEKRDGIPFAVNVLL